MFLLWQVSANFGIIIYLEIYISSAAQNHIHNVMLVLLWYSNIMTKTTYFL